MKKLLVLFLFSTALNFSYANTKLSEQLLSRIGVNNFVTSVTKLKKVKSIEDISSLDYELRHFFKHIKPWYYFDHNEFKQDLLNKINNNFTPIELKHLLKIFKQPFMVKVLNNSILYRDIFSFNEHSIDESYRPSSLVKSRAILIQNIYLMHGMEIQKEYMLKRLKETLENGRTLVKVVKGDKVESVFVDPVELKKRVQSPGNFIIQDFANDLKSFRHYELREYLRMLKGDKMLQRFIQLYANFHFLYLSKYINKVEVDKINQLKSL